MQALHIVERPRIGSALKLTVYDGAFRNNEAAENPCHQSVVPNIISEHEILKRTKAENEKRIIGTE